MKITQKWPKNDPFLAIFWVIFWAKIRKPKSKYSFDRFAVTKNWYQKSPKNTVFEQKNSKKTPFFWAKFRAYMGKNSKKTPQKTGFLTKKRGFSGTPLQRALHGFWSFWKKWPQKLTKSLTPKKGHFPGIIGYSSYSWANSTWIFGSLFCRFLNSKKPIS